MPDTIKRMPRAIRTGMTTPMITATRIRMVILMVMHIAADM